MAFICAASQPEIASSTYSDIRVAELSAIFSGWDHELRTTNYEKKGFLSFFIFFYSKCGKHFFLERLTPWDSRE